MKSPSGYDSKADQHQIEGQPYETKAISQVKDYICDEITTRTDSEEGIQIADDIVNYLLGKGVLIPTGFTIINK